MGKYRIYQNSETVLYICSADTYLGPVSFSTIDKNLGRAKLMEIAREYNGEIISESDIQILGYDHCCPEIYSANWLFWDYKRWIGPYPTIGRAILAGRKALSGPFVVGLGEKICDIKHGGAERLVDRIISFTRASTEWGHKAKAVAHKLEGPLSEIVAKWVKENDLEQTGEWVVKDEDKITVG